MTTTVEVGAATLTVLSGIGAGYIFTWILQKIGRIVLTATAIAVGIFIASLMYLQNIGIVTVHWDKLLSFIISIIVNVVQWISLHVLAPSTGTGLFTAGFMTGIVVRALHRSTILQRTVKLVKRRRMFKIDEEAGRGNMQST